VAVEVNLSTATVTNTNKQIQIEISKATATANTITVDCYAFYPYKRNADSPKSLLFPYDICRSALHDVTVSEPANRYIEDHLRPLADNLFDLGSPSLRFRNLYLAKTSGSILFSDGSKIAEDNANLFWDNVNKRLGIGTTSPAEKLHVIGNVRIDDAYKLLWSDVNLYRGAADVLKTDDNFDALALRIGGSEVITSGRVLQNVSASRSIISDFWSIPFWNNIPDKPSTFPPSTHDRTAHTSSLIPNTVPSIPSDGDIYYDTGLKSLTLYMNTIPAHIPVIRVVPATLSAISSYETNDPDNNGSLSYNTLTYVATITDAGGSYGTWGFWGHVLNLDLPFPAYRVKVRCKFTPTRGTSSSDPYHGAGFGIAFLRQDGKKETAYVRYSTAIDPGVYGSNGVPETVDYITRVASLPDLSPNVTRDDFFTYTPASPITRIICLFLGGEVYNDTSQFTLYNLEAYFYPYYMVW